MCGQGVANALFITQASMLARAKRPFRKGKTILALAVTGDTKRLMAALANGASVDDANEVGYTALMVAAEKGNAALAETLIRAGANVNASTSRKISSARGGTALIYAAEKGHFQIVKLLAAAGANVNAETTWGESPLYHATRRGDLRMIKFLLTHGAKPTWVAAFNAIHNRHADILKELLKAGADPNWKYRKTEETLLGEAVYKTSDAAFVRPLLEYGARPNEITGRRYPLNYAALKGDMPICRLLLKHGAKVNNQDRFERSALMDAAFKGQVKAVKFLLANGANLRLKDDDGKTAWDLAKGNDHAELLPLLEVNARRGSRATRPRRQASSESALA